MNTKQSIRPVIPDILQLSNKSDDEIFQNSVLRPILKLQNDLILAIYKTACISKEVTFDGLKKKDLIAKVIAFIKTDRDLKQDLRAAVLGQFTVDEFEFYSTRKKEMNKRILQMARERIVSQL